MVRLSSFKLSRREQLILSILFLTLICAVFIAVYAGLHERYQRLSREIGQKITLIRKSPAFEDGEKLEALEIRAERLQERLILYTEAAPPGTYAFGEEILALLSGHSITVRRYRPLDESGFTFAGTGTPGNIMDFLADISRNHTDWQFSGTGINTSTRPGELELQFDLHHLSLLKTAGNDSRELQ